MDLTHQDVLEILKLLEQSDVEHFELATGDLKLVASKLGPPAGDGDASARVAVTREEAQAPSPETASSPVSAVATPSPETQADQAEIAPDSEPRPATGTPAETDGLVAVDAPVVGVFYRAPEPGKPPFVEVGSHVEEGATLGLVEVMKMFNSVTATVAGEVVAIAAANEEFVEHGQPLVWIRPETAS